LTEKPFRPLLAASIENNQQLESLTYPMIASPKVDGIRCVVHPSLGPVTRSLKPIRNKTIRDKLNWEHIWGLDGEIVSGPITAPDVFNRTTTAVMTMDGEPKFEFHVFDTMCLDLLYEARVRSVWARAIECQDKYGSKFVKSLPWVVVANPQGVLEAEITWLSLGFEGIMLRSCYGPYKHGRSTLKEQTLLKLKRFKDAEAIITGYEPLYSNQNPQTRNSQGLAERSDHKAGKVQIETLGNLVVRDVAGQYGSFSIGSGFDQSLRDQIWNNRDGYLGKRITFKYQEVSIKEKPRFPIFKGFRPDE